jgi:hypothetical protein
MRNPLPPPPAKPLGLGEFDYATVLALARPLAPDRRDIFLREVAELIRRSGACGGELYRACRELQHKHFDPPIDAHHRAGGKYG